jgi:uncharacterized hydrophobic protein (TIGR00271 family)
MGGITDKILLLIKKRLADTVAKINHPAVIKDVFLECEVSTGYFLTLIMANLIALSGLITNSAPVIIGAMLISPLMGPILSFGFAFITGTQRIWWMSLRKIFISLVVTILVAAGASFLSPLKELTPEILNRTHPNLYDLVVAFLAGSVGAAAICTKKNYLTIVPGVAIATAVIPPLSVAGFGLGVGDFAVFVGGFFLFFTNFVAITLATTVVFFVYGFRSRMTAEIDGEGRLRKRFVYLGVVLLAISIPLVYTLHLSIREVRLRGEVGRLLRHEFDLPKRSRLTAFEFASAEKGALLINAVINTVAYLNEEEILKAEGKLAETLGQSVNLAVEQVKVMPRGLKLPAVNPLAPVAVAPKLPSDLVHSAREGVLAATRQTSERIEKIIAPSTISDFTMGFSGNTPGVAIAIRIKRDTPVSDQERLMLARMLAYELKLPVALTVETLPFVAPLIFKKGEVELSEAMKIDLQALQEVHRRDATSRIRLESFPESGFGPAKRRELARRRAELAAGYLAAQLKLPKERLETVISSTGGRDTKLVITVISSSPAVVKH